MSYRTDPPTVADLGETRGTRGASPPPLLWVKKKKKRVAEGRKASAQYLEPPLEST